MLDQIQSISDVFLDSFFIVDPNRTILDYNAAFAAFFPRNVGQSLRGKKCYDLLKLEICSSQCIVHRAFHTRQRVRMDEVRGRCGKGENELVFILSALPFFDSAGEPTGALVLHRDVTAESELQQKYKALLDGEKHERERLLEMIHERTKALIRTNRELFSVQKELLDFKRGRLI